MQNKLFIIFRISIFWLLPGIAFASQAGPDIVIIYTGDTRCQIRPGGSCCGKMGGVRSRECFIRDTRDSFKNTLLVDSGDFLWKNREDALIGVKNYLAREAVEILRYDVLNIADGEIANLDGLDGMQSMISSNFRALHSGKAKWKPYIIKETGGLKLGFIGLLSPKFLKNGKIGDQYEIADPVETARKILPEVASNADIIVALSHLGWEESKRLAAAVDGIDIMIAGHGKHKDFQPETVKSTFLVKNAVGGSLAGTIKIWADRSGKIKKTESDLKLLTKKIKTHPDYSGIERKYLNEKYAYLGWLRKEITKTMPDREKQKFTKKTTPVKKFIKYLNKQKNLPSFQTFLSTRN